MFSEAAEEREERRAALEREREDVAMSLEGAKERVAKYARVQARSGTKVMKVGGVRTKVGVVRLAGCVP